MTETIKEEFRDVFYQNNEEFIFPSTKGEYWGTISQNNEDFIFPSPVNLPEWLDNTANWLGEGTSVLEIGPGKADLADKVLSTNRKTTNYFIADISEGILKFARERLEPIQNSTKIHFIQGDLNSKIPLSGLKPGSLDRVILINVFGYLDPHIALDTIYKLLRPGGFLRFTSGDYEISLKSGDFDPKNNAQYVRGRQSHIDAGIKPLGYTLSDDGKQVPFYGYRRFYTKEELKTLLNKNGFIIEQFKKIVIPKELWLKVRSSQVNFKTNQEELELLKKWGGRPLWDIIARKK